MVLRLRFRRSSSFLLKVPQDCGEGPIRIMEHRAGGRETVIIIGEKSYLLKKRENSNTHLVVDDGQTYTPVSLLLEVHPRKAPPLLSSLFSISLEELRHMFGESLPARRFLGGGAKGERSRRSFILREHCLSAAEFDAMAETLRVLVLGEEAPEEDPMYFRLDLDLFLDVLLLIQSISLLNAPLDRQFLEVFPPPLLSFAKRLYFACPPSGNGATYTRETLDKERLEQDIFILILLNLPSPPPPLHKQKGQAEAETGNIFSLFAEKAGRITLSALPTRDALRERVRGCGFIGEDKKKSVLKDL